MLNAFGNKKVMTYVFQKIMTLDVHVTGWQEHAADICETKIRQVRVKPC